MYEMHPLEQTTIKKQFDKSVIIHFRKEVYFSMAKKGQKFNKYTEEMIIEVLEELKLGKSSLQISKERNIPAKTIRTWKRKMILHPELNTGVKRGRPKESDLTKEDWKERYVILKKYQAFLKAQRERK